ncbi:MAG: DNA-binding LytR/AlgR family response regulator [Saprospiraceae bacterium]|jgi:DNA-binding LytR/AlgR family response regulator
MMKCLIVDDEHMAHEIIKGYCDLLPNLVVKKHCYDAVEALEYLNEHTVDLIFLDLNMPKLKGFEFLRTLSSPPKIIVTTAYQEHAIEGYELNVVDYLLKPFNFERFLKAVNKVCINPPNLKTDSDSTDKSIFVRSNKKYIQLDINSILYIEAAGNYSKIITTDETITLREKIPDLLILFGSNDLMQVHKSFAISRSKIKSVEGNRILLGEFTVPIGKIYKSTVLQILK